MKLKLDYFAKCFTLVLVALAFGFSVSAQSTITGTVTDQETGEPLIGANILVVGTSTGTVTDFDGNYSLEVPAGASQLEFSYTGYASQTIAIGGQTVINLALSAGAALDEVVVVGYGTQKSKEISSSVTSVKAEDFNKGNVNDPTQLLAGKVAGLVISRPGGDPNAGFNIRLRGLSTAGANTSPLIIIDGVPGASLQSVDPNDIASIDVLKDASAAAIYGTRGASGVILITTKTGKAGTAKIEYNGQMTNTSVDRLPQVMDAGEYRALIKQIGKGTDKGASTDWFDELTRSALSHVHNVTLSGGSQQTTYNLSFNYRNQQGVALKDGWDQVNGRLNLVQKAFNDKLKVQLNLSSTTRDATLAFAEAFRYATVYNPTAPVTGGPDAAKYDGYYQETLFDYYNPVAIMEQNNRERKFKRLVANIRGDYTLAEGLTVGAFYAEQHENSTDNRYYDKNSFWVGADNGGQASRQLDESFTRLFEMTGNYTKKMGKFIFSLFGVYSFQFFIIKGFFAKNRRFLTDEFGWNQMEAGLDLPRGQASISSYKNTNRLVAFFGRANLNFDETYYLSATFRREGASKFGVDNRWGLFPGVSAAVVLTNLFDVSGLDFLKLRAGFGITGNPPVDSYLSLQRIGTAETPTFFYYNGNYIPSYGPVSNPNPSLQWETKRDINVGLDFNLLDYKLNGSLDIYNNTTNNLLLYFTVPVPPNLFPQTWVNIGELQNSGIELALNYNAINKPDFTWQPGVNFTYYLKNKLVSLSNETLDFGGFRDLNELGAPGQNNTPLVRVTEGGPLGQLWGLEIADKNNPVTAEGKWNFKDLDGNGTLGDNTDRTVIGNGLPKFQLNISNTFTFGKFDFNFFLRGVFGHDLINTFRAFYEAPEAALSYNVMKATKDIANLQDAPKFSSYHVENADFVKLDNATLGYTLPLPEGNSFKNVRFFLNGQNLITITGYTGVDPEPRLSDGDGFGGVLSPGIDRRNTYFRTREVTFGVNLGF